MTAIVLFVLVVLVVTAAAVWGEDSRGGGNRSARGGPLFRPERRFD